MKKFLSLVLAMIMTMSLVTISAGATEYKDLTDKDEIQYEEAVAVLNRIGVITGYDDGSFRPETELTRGAAAKIIVSLMIGPDAASALPNTSSPYPDVPASHTFAGVISYCKTAGYISGYGDGTFKPANPLTGYAFAKMLLGAIGYNSDIEGFTGSGWTMNVAKIGNVAGLFDRISFDGAAAVTRDQACQLALNTLKATLVTYGGTSIINGSTGSYTIQGTTASPVTSNNRDINANIGRKDWYGGNNQGSDYLTLEFGEEHFKDLRLEYDKYDPAHDEFGRPSNQWSYKKVTIGTFALPADYTYTTQVAHREDTDGTKEKALGLRNYDLAADGGYSVWQGWGNTGAVIAKAGDTTTLWMNGLKDVKTFADKDSKVADIADYTDNGTLVEVYVSYMDADWITDVVVVQTQLMEVEKIGSDYVALKRESPDAKDGNPDGEAYVGYNQAGIDVEIEDVKDASEDAYELLKGLKVGDAIAVIPVTTDDGKTYEAAEVYVPETVSGAWTRVDTYGVGGGEKERNAISLTVGGTEYKISDWHKKMYDKTDVDIKATRGDITLLMDKYGNAMKAKGIGDTSGFMVIGDFYQGLVNNKICTFVHGWDIGGQEIDINLGSNIKLTTHGNTTTAYGHELGELVRYTSANVVGDADYALTHEDVHSVFYRLDSKGEVTTGTPAYEIKTNNVRLALANVTASAANGTHVTTQDAADHFCDDASVLKNIGMERPYTSYTFADNVKFIYVNYTEGDEVDSIEIKNGRQNVSTKELAEKIANGIYAAQASVKDGKITSVVIKCESSDAKLNQMLYVVKHTGYKEVDKETGKKAIGIIAARFNADGKFEESVEMVIDKDLPIGAWASYSDKGEESINGRTVDNYYHVKSFNRHNTNPAVLYAENVQGVKNVNNKDKYFDYLLRLGIEGTAGDGKGVYSVTMDGVQNKRLSADPKNDGEGATDLESYLLSDYRSYNDVVDKYTVENAEGIVWTQDAEWLNMTNNKDYDKLDSTEDLTDFMDEHPSAKISVTVLLNENPDSDGFRMAQLIVINSVDLGKGGSSTPSISEGEIDLKASNVPGAKITNIVPASRGSELALTIEIPNQGFIASGATTDIDLIVTIDGIEDQFTAIGMKVGTNRFVTANLRLNGDEEISIRPANPDTDLVWSDVNVKYYNGTSADANEIPAANFSVAPTFTTASSTVATSQVAVGLKASKYTGSSVAHVIEGVTGTYTMASANPVNAAAQNLLAAGGSFVAEGTDYVKVVINGLTAQTGFAIAADSSLTYKGIFGATGGTPAAAAAAISTITGTAAHTDTLKVEWAPNTATVAANTMVTFTATVDGVAAAGVAAYSVVVKTSEGDLDPIVVTPTTKTGTASIRMPAEDLTVTGVVVTPLPTLSKTTTTARIVDGYKMEITFNAPVTTAAGADKAITGTTAITCTTGSTSVTGINHTAKSNTVVVELARDFAAADVLTVAGSGAVTNNNLSSDTANNWTFTVAADADGNLTVAVA